MCNVLLGLFSPFRFSLDTYLDYNIKKFGIDTSIHKGNILYIKMNSRNLFTQLISPYFCECMKYKLQSLNSVNLGKSGNR